MKLEKILVMCIIFSALFALFSVRASAESGERLISQSTSGRGGEYVIGLCDGWKFGEASGAESASFNDSSWQTVSIPHTWNAVDAVNGNNSYSRTAKWYRKTLAWQDSFSGKSVYIELTGANTKTDLYVNSSHVYLDKSAGIYTHRGGYTAFRYDITDYLTKGDNVIAVKVDNTRDQAIAPVSGDFNIYGGLYRPVYLVVVDKIHVDLKNNGSSGLFLTTPDVRSKTAPQSLGTLNIGASIVNESASSASVTVTARVIGDNAPAAVSKTVTIAAGASYDFAQSVKVNNPHLWQGISYAEGADNSDVGYRYTVELTVSQNSTVIDKVSDKVGFRYFWIDKNEGFYLNGQKHPLRGVCRHQYKKGIGSALLSTDHDGDIEIIKELGANAVRLSHYPQSKYFYDLCDRDGIIVWSEIPLVNQLGTSSEFADVTKAQLVEMIRQEYNHPSICFWGLENEVGNGSSTNSYMNMKRLCNELNSLAKSEDSSGRYTTQAINQDYSMNQNKENAYGDYSNNTGWNSDILGWNIYPGWYGNFSGTFESVMTAKKAKDSRPMGVSEYGWGANVNQHEAYPKLNQNSLTPYGPWHPEEYQNLMHEQAVGYINTHDYLWGTFIWAMFDFSVDSRNEGSQPGLNDKGLVTNDRITRKDSFYLYKANWNKQDKFVYITSRRWTQRENADTYVKVYSNCRSVELFNGSVSLGKMQSKGNGVFEISSVKLGVGNNTIKAVGTSNGTTYIDSVTWSRKLSSAAQVESDSLIVKTAEKQVLLTETITLGDVNKKLRGVNNATFVVYNGASRVSDVNTVIEPGMILKVTAEDGATTAEYKFVATNICAGKTVTASSAENGNYARYAVDCLLTTRWTAVNNSYPQSIVIDLEREYFMGNLKLNWYDASDRYYKYNVEVSTDGKNYERIIDRGANTTPSETVDSLGLVRGRYLKINVTGCSNSAGYASLYEVSLNGWDITSDVYKIDHENRIIVAESLGDDAGLTPDKFLANLDVYGNCTYEIKVGTGYVNDSDTFVITTGEGINYVYTVSLPETAHLKTTNAAVGKQVYFSSEEGIATDGGDTHGYSAFDSNTSTRWASETNGGTSASYPEWIGVDLGAVYDVSDVELYFETKGGRTYTYEVYSSLDAAPVTGVRAIPSGFEKIVDMSSNKTSGGHYTHALSGRKARYIIVNVLSCDKWTQNTRYVAPSIYELIVNGRTDRTKYDYVSVEVKVTANGDATNYGFELYGDVSDADLYVALYGCGRLLAVKKNTQSGAFVVSEKAEQMKVILLQKNALMPQRTVIVKYFT